MKKAINAWTIDAALDFEATFAAAKKAGFEAIELNIDNVGKSAHAFTLESTEADYAVVRELIKKYYLPVPSISSSLWAGKMGHPEEWDVAEAVLRKQIEAAKAVGADGVLVVPGGMNDDVSLDTARKNCIRFLNAQKAYIEKEGIFVGLENVWNLFFLSPYDAKTMIDEIGCKNLGMYFDVGNVVAFSKPEDWIEILGSRIGKVHVKDYLLTTRTLKGGAFVDITHGSANWAKIIPMLRGIGYDGYLVGEVFKSDENMSYEDYYKKVADEIGEIIKY